MDFIKNRMFSRKSGLRHLAALLLTVVVMVWSYAVFALILEDGSWLTGFYWECYNRFNYYGGPYIPFEKLFWGVVGIMIGMAALMGGLLRRCGESWIIRFFQKFFYSVIGVIPIVNLLVPLIYQRRRKKQGRMEFVSDGSFRASLEGETYRALVTNNTVLHPNGKLRFSIIRYVFVSTFKLIGGVFLLFFALLIPVLTPVPVILVFAGLAQMSAEYLDVVCWIGMGAVALTVLIDVIQPTIALLIHPRKEKAAPAPVPSQPDAYGYNPLPDPETEPDHKAEPEPEDDTPGVTFAEPVAENDHEPEPIPDPEPDANEDTRAWSGEWDEDYAVAENGHGREILNHKEIIL